MKNFGITFYQKKDKVKKNGDAPIYLRIIVKNTRTTMNTGYFANAESWKKTEQLKLTRKVDEVNIRMKLNEIALTIAKIAEKLETKKMGYDAALLKRYYIEGKTDNLTERIMLSELFDKHISNFTKLVESGIRAKDSLRKIRSLRKHVFDYLKRNYHTDDIALLDLDFQFIDGFDLFLRGPKKIENNTTVKYIQAFRHLIRVAIKYDWLVNDPFKLYDKKLKKKDTVWLTQEELNAIKTVELPSERLEVVRDLFLFGCYTGYAPVDMAKLTYNHIILNNDGEYWIFTNRTKTGVRSDVPLLPQAKEIIEKYKEHPYCIDTGKILPARSNQKANMYLKEICVLAGIRKKIVMYTSRHTFACTVILANGLSLEVLSKLMGHKSLKQTMHYGHIQNARVSEEMKRLKDKFNDE